MGWAHLANERAARIPAPAPLQPLRADYRANGTAGHIEGFYRAFDINTGDKLFIAPGKRARIY
jgi:predicted metalloendopeptidase